MTTAAIPRRARIWFEVERHDRWQAVTWIAFAAIVIAVVMAVIGLPPIDFHTPLHYAGIMDPLCGGTRAIRLAAKGDWVASWRFNPVGIPLLIVCVLLAGRALVGWTTRRWVTLRIRWTRRGKLFAWLVVVAFLIALEINQQAHVGLLTSQASH